MVRDEEMLDLPDHGRRHVGDAFDVSEYLAPLTDGNEADVLDHAAIVFRLPRIDDPDQTTWYDAARGHRLVQQNQNVQRIAVVAERGRHESEVEWKGHALRQNTLEHQCAEFRLERELVARSPRRFDYDVDAPRVTVERWKPVERRRALTITSNRWLLHHPRSCKLPAWARRHLSRADILSDDTSACQRVAEAAIDEGVEAIMWESAARDGGLSMAIFLERLDPASCVVLAERADVTRERLAEIAARR
jgi:hypothetical protein